MGHARIKPKHAVTRQHHWYSHWPLWVLFGVFAALISISFIQMYRSEGPQKSDIQAVVLAAGQDLHIDPAELKPTELHLFEGSASGQKVKFIVRRTQDNVVHVSLATCRACYRSKNPHYVQKNEMMCGECNMPMRSESEKGAPGDTRCTLPEIPHTETAHDITVLIRDVLAQTAKVSRKG
ncbi:MAG: DUF2318 domain-containing protein [Acidobacteria bacterium]|nr:DUF2318 domain-containing protein [Acidobacteriota bacterium]